MDKKQMKSIMLLILFTVMLYVGLQNIDVVLGVLGTMIGLVFPFILGGGIAFVLNVPMSFLERNIFGRGRLKNSRRAAKAARPVSLILALLLVILIIMIAGFVILPELGSTVMGLGKGIETGIRNLQIWIDSTFQNNSAIVEWANSLEIEPQKMVDSIMGVLQNGVNNILSSAVTVTVGIANTAMNASIAFVFACYILIQKEKLMVQAKKALFALLPEKTVNYLLHVCSLANNTFSRFVTGQCIEAVILGTMFFVAMTIFRFPYAMLVGVLIAFTALIPIFGESAVVPDSVPCAAADRGQSDLSSCGGRIGRSPFCMGSGSGYRGRQPYGSRGNADLHSPCFGKLRPVPGVDV